MLPLSLRYQLYVKSFSFPGILFEKIFCCTEFDPSRYFSCYIFIFPWKSYPLNCPIFFIHFDLFQVSCPFVMGNALCWRFKVNRSFSIFYCGCDEYAYEDEAEVVQVI